MNIALIDIDRRKSKSKAQRIRKVLRQLGRGWNNQAAYVIKRNLIDV